MKKIFTLLNIILFFLNINAQKKITANPTNIGEISNVISVPSITEQIRNGAFIPTDNKLKNGSPKIRGANSVVSGKGLPKGIDPLVQLQIDVTKIQGRVPSLVFDADISQSTPSDPTGAVGPNHYIAAWNNAFRIFDKFGNPLMSEASLATIFPGNALGDPIVLYDAAADRFIITEFDGSPHGFNIAISQGSDPINDGWHVYTTGFGTGGSGGSGNAGFPDYPKFSIWSDGYYVTTNIFGVGNQVFVMERDEMLQGNMAQFVALPLPGILTGGFYSPQVFNVGNQTLPAVGNATVIYMQDDEWAGVSQDHLKLWTINVDWNNTSNSTISTAQQINTAAFTGVFDGSSNNFSNLTQPGGVDVDALQATISNQAQFRKFATHNSAVFNFVVDVAAGPDEQAAIRWFELRQANDSAPWTLFQEGTYAAPNNKHAWAGSMAMDSDGNIGMAYTSMGGTNAQRIAINYTGRFASDSPGVMTINEELIAQGSANSPSIRYADYVHLTIDPNDDKTFWHIAEYFNPNRRDVVGVFKIAPINDNDTGVISIDSPTSGLLSNFEQVTITIFNFGNNSQFNIPISLKLSGVTVASETFAGPLASTDSASFTFAATVDLSNSDQTYVIEASTNLSGDEEPSNDSTTVNITNQIIYCKPAAIGPDGDCNLDGIKQFVLNTIDTDDGENGCNTEGGTGVTGYADRRSLTTTLGLDVETYDMQVQMNWVDGVNGNEKLSAWIDFNDNGTFESEEQLISGATFSAANELVTFALTIPSGSNLGNHTLRVQVIDTSVTPGDINNPCADYRFGETHDYSVNIVSSASVDDSVFGSLEMLVADLGNNQFDISLSTFYVTEQLKFSVTNMLGQILVGKQLENVDGNYKYLLDMASAAPGVYIIRIGNAKEGKVRKIFVK